MAELSTWYQGLVSAAYATPVWATVLLALMVVTTSGRPHRVLRVLFGLSPLLTWVLAAAVLGVAFSGWVPGGEEIVSTIEGMSWFIVLLHGGWAGFLTWMVCLVWIAVSRHVEGLGRFLRGWPFWVIPPVVLAVAWRCANQRLGMPSTYAFWIAFGGTGAWAVSVLWVGMLLLRNGDTWASIPGMCHRRRTSTTRSPRSGSP